MSRTNSLTQETDLSPCNNVKFLEREIFTRDLYERSLVKPRKTDRRKSKCPQCRHIYGCRKPRSSDQTGWFGLVNSRINHEAHAIAYQIVVILSFAAASISLWPANLLQSLLRTGFTSVPGVWFYYSSPIFQYRGRTSANCTSNFVSPWLLAIRRHVLKYDRFVFLTLNLQKI